MIYATSDLHGCYEKYVKMLRKIAFSDNDTMYVLGDIVDRGADGIKILLDLMNRKNIVVLKGNHDFIAYKLLLARIFPERITDVNKTAQDYILWLSDGGETTFRSFQRLSASEKTAVLDFINSFLIYEEIDVGENSFFLSHTIPSKEKMLDFDNCRWQDFIFGSPEYDKCYFDDKYVVTGHTPTGLISEKYLGKIYRANNHVAIDCGAVFGNPLGCICLDTFEEFYVY